MNELDDKQRTDEGLRELALFAGAGGGILAGKLLGWRTVCAVEREPYAASVLAARQNDGILEAFPIWSDVCTFDGKPWRGLVDVVSGGFPCQDISASGNGAGIDGAKSSMWKPMGRIIGEVRPKFAYMENSPLLVSRGLAVVLGDLAEMGYDAEWGCLSASSLGANHVRDRIWILATDSNLPQHERGSVSSRVRSQHSHARDSRWWQDPSELHRVDDGVAHRLDRLKAIGNGQVSRVAATAFYILSK
jgi:Site-specific DNA methylase